MSHEGFLPEARCHGVGAADPTNGLQGGGVKRP